MSRHSEVVGLCAVGLSVLLGIHFEYTLRAQDVPQSAARFDVVSIKPNQSGADGNSIRPEPGGGFVATNVTAKMLLRIAFDNKSAYGLLHEYQIVGGPRWIDSRHFDC
jgi:hypothetical protein